MRQWILCLILAGMYGKTASDPAIWPESLWRSGGGAVVPTPGLAGEVIADLAVVGAGFTGLNAARAAQAAGMDVVVLEAAAPGWGASGRNGGFCCLGGSALSDLQIQKLYGMAEARSFHHFQRAAVDHVASVLDSLDEPADRHSDGELCLAHRPGRLPGLIADAEVMRSAFGLPFEAIAAGAMAENGIAGPKFFGGVRTEVGFALNPMKTIRAIGLAARAEGVRISEGTPVTALVADHGRWRLSLPDGQVLAHKVLVATNGYTPDALLPPLRGTLLPVISAIGTTAPLSPDQLAAQGWHSDMMIYDSRKLLHYFRLLPDRRFLFGMRGGLRWRLGHGRLKARSRRHFAAMFPAWSDVAYERFWAGLICVTRSLIPFCGAVPGMAGVYASLGYHGNGVAAGSYAGHLIGQQIAGAGSGAPGLLQGAPRRFPLPALRRAYLAGAYAMKEVQDRIG